ncbi:hypothetical protein [Nannocystis sp. SCPEA4]|uniref:hypothetical protein n=1 Tax=Nannocystis sp. SCPEA4 TaxID=2996787 RepID=UPI00226FC7F3|nr:hypothetical protein [Nannocystis sp. SCPEA4]MCY1059294.1 hypothetical protein [Nannocystis sp. SCPEA4]
MSVGLARSLALALLFACTPHTQSEPEAEELKVAPMSPAELAPRIATPPVIVPLPEPEFPTAPGHLEDGHYYVKLRPQQLQDFVAALPIAAERERALALVSAGLGLRLRSIEDLGLERDGVITGTLMRPVAPRIAAVREQIQQIAVAPTDDPAAIPPLPPELLRDAAAMTYHNRLHIPVRDPEILLALVRKQERASGLCERLPHDACVASDGATILLRRDGGALVVDAFVQLYSNPDVAADDGRVEAAAFAMAARPAKLAALASLAGDFALYIHGATIPAIDDIFALGELADTLAGTPSGQRRAVVDARLAEHVALLRLRDTRRLFAGLSVSAVLDPADVRITMSWEPADLTAAQALEHLFAPASDGLPGPSRAALCDGALLCWQLPPLPRLSGFHELALGDYAGQDRLGPTIAAAGQMGLVVLAVETWPNQLGALERWSLAGGREAGIARTFVELAGGVRGTGGMIRPGATGETVLYARFHQQELGLVRSLATVGGATFTDVPVDGLERPLAAAALGDRITAYIASEPDEKTGWIIAADHLDRARWLLTQAPRELTTAPTFFLGSDDLAGLLAQFGPVGAPNLATWTAGRKLSVIGEFNRARPRVQIALTRAAPGQ